MGNHSETGEILEEALEIPFTGMSVTGVDSLVDEYGNIIELDNPTRLKDSSERDIQMIKPSYVGALEVKPKKKKAR